MANISKTKRVMCLESVLIDSWVFFTPNVVPLYKTSGCGPTMLENLAVQSVRARRVRKAYIWRKNNIETCVRKS